MAKKQSLTNASEFFEQQTISREKSQTTQEDLTSAMNIMSYDEAVNLFNQAFWNGNIKESNKILDEFIKGCDFRYNRLVQSDYLGDRMGTQRMMDQIYIRESIDLILLKINMIELSSGLSPQEKIGNKESIYDKVILYANESGLVKTKYITILQKYLDFLTEHDMSDKAEQIENELKELRKKQI